MPAGEDCLAYFASPYLHFPGQATVGEALRAYHHQGGQWWWLLTTAREGRFYVCSFGSLLPYLTGRTGHIVHNIGDCVICCGIDPLLWRDTGALLAEALADEAVCARPLADLPLADLPVVAIETVAESAPRHRWFLYTGRVCGLTENGALRGVHVDVMRDLDGGRPDF